MRGRLERSSRGFVHLDGVRMGEERGVLLSQDEVKREDMQSTRLMKHFKSLRGRHATVGPVKAAMLILRVVG